MPDEKERARSGGHGIYYHLSYWSDYLWQVTIAPQLIAHQLGRAYDFEMKNLWVVNVGDIKAAERETQFFMDLAWDIDRWRDGAANKWVIDWSSNTFGKQYSEEIGYIINEYYRLAWRGKPEHIGHTVFNELESKQRIEDYKAIAQKADVLRAKMPKRLETAYFHLVYYPVVAVAAQNEKILLARRSALESERGQADKSNESFDQAELAFEKIKALTEEYNQLGDGKWNHIMNYKPRNLKVLKEPVLGLGLIVKGAVEPQNISMNKTVATAPWEFKNSILSATSTEVCNVENGGRASFTFNAMHNGFIQLHVSTKSEKGNSLFAQINEGPWVACHISHKGEPWRWATLNDLSFKSGENKLTICTREPGVQIKEIRTTRKVAKQVPHGTTKQQYEDLMRIPDAIFTLKDTHKIIKGDGRTNIVVEEGLSIDGYGAYLMPHRAESYIHVDKAPTLQFKVNLKAGTYKARVKFLPSRPTSIEHEMRCAFSVDGEQYVIENVQEPKETFHNHHSCNWTTTLVSEACLDGYISKDYEFKSDGETTIQIKMLDTGMVFHRIEIFKEVD